MKVVAAPAAGELRQCEQEGLPASVSLPASVPTACYWKVLNAAFAAVNADGTLVPPALMPIRITFYAIPAL